MERLIRFIVDNRTFTLIFALAVVLTAWVRLPTLTIKQNPSIELPTLMITVVLGGASAREIEQRVVQVAEDLKAQLRAVHSIEDVELVKPDEEIRVDLDIARMSTYGIDVHQVAEAIRANNRFLPTGSFNLGEKSITILPFAGGYHGLEPLRDTILISRSGSALALRDIANIRIAKQPDSIITRINGKSSTWISMRLNDDANVFEVKREMDLIIDAAAIDLAQRNIEVLWLFEVESGVAYKMTQLLTNIMQGIVILTIVLLFAVGYRSGFVIALMLPMALGLSMVGLALTDYGLQGVSLAGFIISLGLIVDNGIVVTENTYRLQTYRGLDAREAAIKGTASVLAPLISSTLTTALAFAPLFLLTSTTGLYLRSLVATIWLCLAASLIVAVTFSCLLLSRIGTENKLWSLPPPPSFMQALMPFRDRQYATAVRYFIRRPWVLLLAIMALLWLTGLAAASLPIIVFPDSEEPFFTVTVEAPADRTIGYTDAVMKDVSERVRGFDEVVHCSSIVGSGFPFVDTGIQHIDTRRHNAMLFCEVNFRDSNQMSALVSQVNIALAPLAAQARINASPFTVGGEAGSADIELLLSGPRIEGVREQARMLQDTLVKAEVKGIRAFDNPALSRWFALDIKFKERVANALGVNRSHVDQVLILLTHGNEVDDLRIEDGTEYPIVLRAEKDFEAPLAVFDRLFVTSSRGDHIPLSQVLEVSFTEDEYDIEHRLFKPIIKIGINAMPGVDVNELTRTIQAALADISLPKGYQLVFEGQLAKTAEEFGGAGKYVGIVGLLILAIFVLQFKSILQPLVVCAAIPLSFIGAFMMLYGWNQPMSFLAFIGMTSLMGIVVNNSILLVDEGNQLRLMDPDMPISEVAINAGCNRFMPILLTSITSIVGLLPLALGNTMFKALVIVVIGGLTTSTFLTLLCVPVLFSLVTGESKPVQVTQRWAKGSTGKDH